MAEPVRVRTEDAVCRLVQNGELNRSLNTLRTIPGAPNPFVVNQQPKSTQTSKSSIHEQAK